MHPVRGATVGDGDGVADEAVSIHAPRAGRDRAQGVMLIGGYGFNPRAPCGARQVSAVADAILAEFQSTRPVWGATSCHRCRRVRCAVSIHAHMAQVSATSMHTKKNRL